MSNAASAMRLTRAQVASYRFLAQDLQQPTREPTRCAVLLSGVQDYPVGASAHLALRARVASATAADIAAGFESGALAVLHSVRGAAHVHRDADVPLLTTALRLDDAREVAVANAGPFWAELPRQGIDVRDALDEVAGAMRAVMADGEIRSKGQLSAAIQATVDKRLRPWCEGCRAHHVQDLLFRLATLQAGLRIRRGEPSDQLRFLPHESAAPTERRGDELAEWSTADRGARPRVAGGAREEASATMSMKEPDQQAGRRELVRRFLRLCGPATPSQLAAWLALAPPAGRALWRLVDTEVVAVDVEGKRAWVHAYDLDELLSATRPDGVRLLPPYDPVTELAHRELLVPEAARRRDIWRAAANPGVLLAGGEVVATWRQRRTSDRLAVIVRPFHALEASIRRAAQLDAEALTQFVGAQQLELRIEDDR
jgi:hypothetical protein